MVHGVRTRVVAWTIVLRQSVTEDYLFELREQFNGDGSDDDGADGKRRYLGLRVSCGRFEPSTLIPARQSLWFNVHPLLRHTVLTPKLSNCSPVLTPVFSNC